jgi:hypothetical protein
VVVRQALCESQNSVRAVAGGRLPAIHAESDLTGSFQQAPMRGIDPKPSFDLPES